MKRLLISLTQIPLLAMREFAGRARNRFALLGLGVLAMVTPSHGQTTNGCVPVPDGLIGWWSAEGNAADFTGAHSGTFPYGAVFSTGMVGQAFDFDGSYRRVSIADSAAFQLTNAMTLEAWVYPRAFGGFIAFRGDNRPGLDTWTLDTYDTGYVKFQIDDEANNYEAVRAPLVLNQWQHVAATWDRASGAMKIYVNGVLVQQTNTTVIPIGVLDPGSEPAIGIGNHGGTFHQFPFNGLIDELGIYNRALTDSEVVGIFAAASAGKCGNNSPTNNPPTASCAPAPSGLVSWWQAENNSADSAGPNIGILSGGMGFVPGKVGQGYDFNGSSQIKIPASSNLDVGMSSGLTLEMWMQPGHFTLYEPQFVFEWNNLSGGYGVQLLLSTDHGVYGDGFGNVMANLVDTLGNSHGLFTASDVIVTNAFQHVALTYDKTSGLAVIYVNGLALVSTNLGSFTPQTSYDLYLGNRPAGPFAGSYFNGVLDEPSIYSRALSPAEIQSIYAAGSAGKCQATNPPVVNCVPAPSGVVGWWPAEGNANNISGTNIGGLMGGLGFAPGKVGQAFSFNDSLAAVRVPASLEFNVGVGPGFTLEAWINPTDVTQAHALFEWNDATYWGVHFFIAPGQPTSGSPGPAGPGQLYANVVDSFGGWHQLGSAAGVITTWVFHHVVLTYDKASGMATIYRNGEIVSQLNLGSFTPLTTQDLYLGRRQAPSGEAGSFAGLLDEPTVYNRALSQAEIQTLYAAGAAGKCSSSTPTENCVAPPTDMVAWWRAEGGVTDVFGNPAGVLVGGAGFAEGRVGQAFSVNGDEGKLMQIPDSPGLNLTNTLTFEAWVNVTAHSANDAVLVVGKDAPSGVRQYMIGLVNVGGKWVFRAHLGLTSGFMVMDGTAAVLPGDWYHVALTYDGSQFRSFVNGTLDASMEATGAIVTSAAPLLIGGFGEGPWNFNGRVDEVSLYSRALSQGEIAAICSAGSSGKCAPTEMAPVITQQPQDVLAILHSTAEFNVVATGAPAPNYQWYYANDPLDGQTNATLSLNNVQISQEGSYSVRVFNASGSVLSSNAFLTVATTQAVQLVTGETPAYYNDALGTILDGTEPQFPLPLGLGPDSEIVPADEPSLSAGAAILGDWLGNPPELNTNWRAVASIPSTWELNTETAIIYPVDGGPEGVANLRGDFDADNGVFVWVNGQYKFGALAPGLPSPIGQFEYANIDLGSLPPGSNYIQVLREDSGVSTGYQIRITGLTVTTNRQPPIITQEPLDQSVAAGSQADLSVTAIGTPELVYQWRFNGADLAGATNATLTFPNVQPTNAGAYSVYVSNAYGAVTSAVATLTVLTYPPSITAQPQDQNLYIGKTASFTVQATGTAPLRYQWTSEGAELSAVTKTLTLVNVQSNDAGLYQVVVNNDYGSATSRWAQLTVTPPPPCTPTPDGVIAWWSGESNLWDVVGGFDGVLSSPTVSQFQLYTLGKVGAAINCLNRPIIVAARGGALNLDTNTGLTIEGWIRPQSYGVMPVAEWNTGNSVAGGFPTATVGAGLFVGSAGPGMIEATLTGTNRAIPAVTFRSAAYTLTNLVWQHVALTYDKSNGLAVIYVNGASVAQTNLGTITPLTSGDFYLGNRQYGQYAGSYFFGALDEITLYNRALSGAELQSIVAADETGKCPVPRAACTRPPLDIAAWWPGESNTVDLVAGNDAVRVPTNFSLTLSYQAGQLGTAFSFKGQNFLQVPRSEGLDVGAGSGLTIEAWISPTTLTPMPIVEWTDTNTYGANLWLSYSRGPTVLEANLIDAAGGFHLIRSLSGTIRGSGWQHVAVTYDKTTGIAALYSDGSLVVTTNLGVFTPRTHTELLVGFHPRATASGPDGAPPLTDLRFLGAMDELAIYRRALTAGEIRNVAKARPGKCEELPPAISRHPQEQITLEGGNAGFDVGVGGTTPFQYQWLLAGNAIAGATNPTLSVTGVLPADAGLYSVVISNLFGTITSRTAALTVLPANQCLSTPSGAVAFWRGESNTLDTLGNHPAEWPTNVAPFYTTSQTGAAMVGTGFRFNGLNQYLHVPASPDLDVAAGGGFTVEGWIKPDAISGNFPIWDWNDNRQNVGVGLMLGRAGPGSLEVTLTDTNGYSSDRMQTLTTPNYTIGSSTNPIPAWTHMALTFDKAASKVQVFVNARLVGERTLPAIYSSLYGGYKMFSPATTGNLTFGWRPSGVYSGPRFRGAMDELTIYYRALTPLELQAIYVVGSNGKCDPVPSCQALAPGVVSWWRGESNTVDSVTGNHGVLSPNPPTYMNGIAGNAFRITTGRYVQIPGNSSTDVGLGSGFTFETWFKPDVANSTYVLASWYPGTSAQGVSIGSSPTRGPNYLEANLVDTLGNSHVLSLYTYSPYPTGTYLSATNWNHLALTYEKASGQAALFINGTAVVVTNLGSFTPRTTGALTFGYRPPGNYPGGGLGLVGGLDEILLYSRALTAAEITASYRNVANRCLLPPVIVQQPGSIKVNPGSVVAISVVAEGSPLLRYQWSFASQASQFTDKHILPGQTNSVLTLSGVQRADAGRYSVSVTNVFGGSVSSNALVQVNHEPVANPDMMTTASNAPALFVAAKLVLNDSDADGDALTVMAVSPTSGQGGAVSLASGMGNYVPPVNFVGNDTFTYTVADGWGGTAVGTVMVTVGSGGAAPLNIVVGPKVDGNDFMVRFAGVPGLTYTVEAGPSPTGPWTKVANLAAPITNQGFGIGIFEFREPVGLYAARFYRTIYPAY